MSGLSGTVVSVLAQDVESLVEIAREQVPFADVIELRLDHCWRHSLRGPLKRAIARLERPILVAINGPEAFGAFTETDEDRFDVLEHADAAGARFIDVPWFSTDRRGFQRARRVLSRHLTDGTPGDLAAVLAELELRARPEDTLKLVTQARCAEDALRLLILCRRRAAAGRPIVAFSSGPLGSFSRILAPIAGSLATYAAPIRGSGTATAPGQIPADELRAAWPSSGPRHSTRILGVVGRPVGHSLSPLVQGAGLRALGLDAVYVAFEPADLANFLALAKELGVHGLSVTMPFKAEAAQLAKERDASVEACGAANTLVWIGDGWSATNTDATAVRTCVGRSLCTQDRKLAGTTAIVIGTGGAARAALYGLRGAELIVAGRDAQKTASLARAFGARACEPAQIATIAHDVLVHTTPLGSKLHPDICPIAPDALRKGSIVLDAVYRPADTPLLRAARAAGAVAIPGADWFLEQALAQFRAFTAAEPPVDAMRAALTSALTAEDTA